MLTIATSRGERSNGRWSKLHIVEMEGTVTRSVAQSTGWYKSSRSGTGNCVEVLMTEQAIAVRDSKAPAEGQLRFTQAEWRAFVDGVRLGEFDLPESGLPSTSVPSAYRRAESSDTVS